MQKKLNFKKAQAYERCKALSIKDLSHKYLSNAEWAYVMSKFKKEFICPCYGDTREDSGMARICCLDPNSDSESDMGVYFRVISWDESRNHKDYKEFAFKKGKMYKVTVEEL